MASLDWLIVAAVFIGVIALGIFTQRFMRSIADFLAAGRSAGRYLITISYGVANLGAITVLAFFEQNYAAGATLMWWEALLQVGLLIAMLSGWVIYRFRQTRCLTLAEFFERRYGRKFRIFAGLLAFIAGVLNFAIFPLIGSKFFVFFCGLPVEVSLFGAVMPTHVPLMVLLLGTAIWFVFTGGQVSVLVTDFAQGVVANVVFVVIAVFLMMKVNWGDVASVLAVSDPGQSKINPFDTSSIQHFGILFFVISFIEMLYGQMSWQGEQAYFTSARSAHEARMGGVLRLWFLQIRLVFFLVVPLVAFVIMHSDQWTAVQEAANTTLSHLDDPQDANGLRVPVILALILPVGLKGLMAAMMLAAFISTHNTYLHSWGSILTQDVVLPIMRSKGVKPGKTVHFWLLRGAVLLVALFAFGYSAFLHNPTEPIMLYLAITGAIFLGWSGTVIIGGLYWDRGTARAAWVTAIFGSCFTLGSFVLQRMNDDYEKTGRAFFNWFGTLEGSNVPQVVATHMPDGKEILGLTMVICVAAYVLISWFEGKSFDLDTLLHRSAVSVDKEASGDQKPVSRWGRLLSFTPEHTALDRWTAILTVVMVGGWFLVFVIGTIWALAHLANGGSNEQMTDAWLRFWHWRIWLMLGTAAIATVVLAVGGVGDLRYLMRKLATNERDDEDDGSVD
ncbi:MAG: SSS family solute:Na+ symporter [Candidatus Krumholzibacteriia bacterium]|jgi:SSS family solute:Na+ symporter